MSARIGSQRIARPEISNCLRIMQGRLLWDPSLNRLTILHGKARINIKKTSFCRVHYGTQKNPCRR
jgi:hypothetical protein